MCQLHISLTRTAQIYLELHFCVELHTKKSPAAELRGRVCLFLFVCPSRYDARHRKPRRYVYALNLGGTGISPPDKSPPPGKRPPGQKHPRTKIPPAKSPVATYSITAVAGNGTILVLLASLVLLNECN